MEKEFIEINSTVESDDETVEEIIMETFSAESPENMVSEEKGSVKVTSTDSSTVDPKGDLNKTESTESVPSKKKWSRRNRRPKRKNVKKENSNLKQTEPKLKGKVADSYSCADNCEPGTSKIKHPRKHSASNERKRRDQFSRITQAELDVFFSKSKSGGINSCLFRNKQDDPDVIVRNKARLAIQGFDQVEGLDYDEVHAPVARLEAIRMMRKKFERRSLREVKMFLGLQVHQNKDMKCTSAGCQFLGDSLISWQCKKQQLTFAAEAKCVTASAAYCSQVLWIQHQLKDYGLTYLNSTTYFDNDYLF
ncbi:uncharacterized protein LOC110914342 [Helianthus annuus]|uniref:uncharacterized protein LOC110914342 n=1 Tax=Helianthus annuus TaxID=4232 RepID=UPI000B8FD7BA|nr:uncharacterized protein LOC110914342 [Helianthus annuus]